MPAKPGEMTMPAAGTARSGAEGLPSPAAVAVHVPAEAAVHVPAEAAAERLTIIRAQPGWKWINPGELWQYRELLWQLALRDIQVRYKQTALGAAWAVLQPLLMAGVFTIVMSRFAGSKQGGVPYPLFAFCGFLLWTYFSRVVTAAATSVLQSYTLVTKVYFPRLLLPLAAVGAPLVDFCVAAPLVGLLMLWYSWPLSWLLLWTIPVLLATTLAGLGVGTGLAALNVAYRDFKHTLPFLIQLWMFGTPAIYLSSWGEGSRSLGHQLIAWNPVNAYVAAFRDSILGTPPQLASLGLAAALGLGLFVLGCAYYRRVERTFADVI